MIVIYVVESSKQATIVSISISIQELMVVFTLATALLRKKNEREEKKGMNKSWNVPCRVSKVTLNCRRLHNRTHCYLWIDDSRAAPAARWNIFGVVGAQTVRMVLTLITNDCLLICSTWGSAAKAVREKKKREMKINLLSTTRQTENLPSTNHTAGS